MANESYLTDDYFDNSNLPKNNQLNISGTQEDAQNYLTPDYFGAKFFPKEIMQKTGSFIKQNLLPDIGQGLAESGVNLANLALEHLPFSMYDVQNGKIVRKNIQIPEPNIKKDNLNTADRFIQGAASFVPFTLAPEAKGAEVAGEALPFLKSWSTIAPRLAGEGAAYGFVNEPQNRTQGATENAILNVLGYPIGYSGARLLSGGINAATGLTGAIGNKLAEAFGSKEKPFTGFQNVGNTIKNKILDFVENQSKKNFANTPEETAANLKQNFSDNNQNPLPVDLGTVANNSTLSSIYKNLRYVPFSGVGQYSNKINDSLLNNKIQETINDISKQKLSKQGDISFLKKDLDQNNQYLDQIKSQLDDLNASKNSLRGEINQYPQTLQSLSDLVPQGQKPSEHVYDSFRNAFKNAKQESDNLYAPINNSKDLDLSQLSGGVLFPKTQQLATDMLNNRADYFKSFGTDSDMGNSVINELKKIAFPLKKVNEFGEKIETAPTLGSVRTRIQNLMQLAAQASNQGDREQAMNLGNLGNNLKQDLDNLLRNNGKEDLADQIEEATNHYRDKVIPFYADKEFNNVVKNSNYTPKSFYSFSKKLHIPNNDYLLNTLPDSAKKAALQRLIMGPGGEASEKVNLTPEEIQKNWSSNTFTPELKQSINKYAPDINDYFSTLSNKLNEHDLTKNQLKDLNSLYNKTSKYSENIKNTIEGKKTALKTQLEKLSKQLQDLQNQKLSSNISKGMSNEGVLKTALGFSPAALSPFTPYGAASALIGGVGLKKLAETLRDPELIQKYINKERYPEVQSLADKISLPLARRAVLPAANTIEEEKR